MGELLVAQKEAGGLEMRLRESHQRNKDLENELRRAKDMLELTDSKFTGDLNKAKVELEKTRDKVRSTNAELEMTKDKWERAKDCANLCEQMASATIDDIKAGVEARID